MWRLFKEWSIVYFYSQNKKIYWKIMKVRKSEKSVSMWGTYKTWPYYLLEEYPNSIIQHWEVYKPTSKEITRFKRLSKYKDTNKKFAWCIDEIAALNEKEIKEVCNFFLWNIIE